MTVATIAAIPMEIITNGPGDQSPEQKATSYNKLYNSQFASAKVSFANVEVRAAMVGLTWTNATPIVVTTPYNHNLVTGDDVVIRASAGGVGGSIDGYWIITKTANNAFSLNGSTATGGATVIPVGVCYANQSSGTPPRTPADPVFPSQSYFWSPWFADTDVEGGGSDAFEYVSNGAQQTGEILFKGSSFGLSTHYLGQQLGFRGIASNGQHWVFSCYLKCATSPSNVTINVMQFPAIGPSAGTVSGTLLTSTYKRFVWNWLPNIGGNPDIPNPEATIEFTVASGTGADITIARPSFTLGDVIPAWTPFTDGSTYTPNGADVISAWSRTVSQVITRDATTPYV